MSDPKHGHDHKHHQPDPEAPPAQPGAVEEPAPGSGVPSTDPAVSPTQDDQSGS